MYHFSLHDIFNQPKRRKKEIVWLVISITATNYNPFTLCLLSHMNSSICIKTSYEVVNESMEAEEVKNGGEPRKMGCTDDEMVCGDLNAYNTEWLGHSHDTEAAGVFCPCLLALRSLETVRGAPNIQNISTKWYITSF